MCGSELNLDVSAEHARALHRIVRAMHDGHCPQCGWLGNAELFEAGDNHLCPMCKFKITGEESRAALKAFRPYLKRSLEVFEAWRNVG